MNECFHNARLRSTIHMVPKLLHINTSYEASICLLHTSLQTKDVQCEKTFYMCNNESLVNRYDMTLIIQFG